MNRFEDYGPEHKFYPDDEEPELVFDCGERPVLSLELIGAHWFAIKLQTFDWACKVFNNFVWILRTNETVLYGLLSFENLIHLQINKVNS